MTQSMEHLEATGEKSSAAGGYRYYVVAVLAMTYAFSFMDRNIVSILLGDLKAEFDLNDTQLGLLGGLSFALFYSVLAIPIARFADRSNRVNIIAVAVTLWSAVTAACAAVGNFTQLLLCRVGVGVGEAGGLSPAHSVLSDYFKPSERSFAISLFSLGAVVGSFMGLVMGGYVAEQYGWRTAFLVAGLPGILLALLVKMTVREPIRGAMDDKAKAASSPEDAPGFLETIQSLFRNRIYLGAIIGHTLAIFASYSITVWLPQIMLRNFDVSQTEVGTLVGLVFLLGGTTGMLSGGYLATRVVRQRSAKWELLIPCIGLTVALPIYLLGLAASTAYLCAIAFGVAGFFFGWQHGPSLAVVQNYVKPEQRATAASLNFFASNLLGLGLGPLVVGVISDGLAEQYGNAALNIAVGISTLSIAPAILAFYLTSRLIDRHGTVSG